MSISACCSYTRSSISQTFSLWIYALRVCCNWNILTLQSSAPHRSTSSSQPAHQFNFIISTCSSVQLHHLNLISSTSSSSPASQRREISRNGEVTKLKKNRSILATQSFNFGCQNQKKARQIKPG